MDNSAHFATKKRKQRVNYKPPSKRPRHVKLEVVGMLFTAVIHDCTCVSRLGIHAMHSGAVHIILMYMCLW